MRHPGHPRLRADLHELINLIFEVAARGMGAYERLKRERGLLDFVDQEVLALRLLDRPDTLDMLRDQLDLVLVDEFQDTSPLQLAIFLKLAGVATRSVWVGDPKQAIFGFRGTDPALMDAAIESLVNPSRDPDLVAAAIDAVTSQSQVETLNTSYRSRPELVAITNAVFARAFSLHQGMPEARVRLRPDRHESPELGPAISHWPLLGSGRMSGATRAHAVAAGARALLDTGALIWDRHTRSQRPATFADVAILCRTNDQCRQVSEALGQLGIASVVARVGLLDSAEAQVLIAGLELWVDPRDRLAAATLARVLDHPDDPEVFLNTVLAPNARDALAASPAVALFVQSLASSSVTAGGESRDLDVLAATDAVVNALDLRRLCASWGSATQRTANLDALRAHASSYCDERRAGGDAPSVVGFLTYLRSLISDSLWDKSRHDTAARVGPDESVTVSTWHAAKGLEWPIVILFGLENIREPEAYGVHVLTDRTRFDVGDPLGGRWIHFWPNPYTTGNQGGPIKDAYARSPAFQQVLRQSEREALRVLYVGWTRARDQLVLAAENGKLLGGLLNTLEKIEPGLIVDPGVTKATLVETTWGRHALKLQVTPCQPLEATPSTVHPGTIRTGRPGTAYPAGSIVPSAAPPRKCRLGEPVVLGAPAQFRQAAGLIDRNNLGMAVHAFFAADDPDRASAERLAIAGGLLQRYAVADAMAGGELVALADRLWRWTTSQFGEHVVVRREWPVGLRFDVGTIALGTVDLILEGDGFVAVVDHKSFGLAAAAEKVDILGGQLGSYADALKQARPTSLVSTWVHLALAGLIVPAEVVAD